MRWYDSRDIPSLDRCEILKALVPSDDDESVCAPKGGFVVMIFSTEGRRMCTKKVLLIRTMESGVERLMKSPVKHCVCYSNDHTICVQTSSCR